MKTLCSILLFLPLFSFSQTKINYKVYYNDKMETNGIKVQVYFSAKSAADSTYFRYKNEEWGEKNLTNCLKNLKGTNTFYRFRIVPDSNRIVVYHPKSKNVDFSYYIQQDYKGESNDTVFRPRVKNHYFHVLGHNLFAVPETIFDKKEDDPQIIANIEWVGFPEKYTIHNTFGSNQRRQTLKVKFQSEFHNSLFVGGDYRVHVFSDANKPIYFAIRDEWMNYTDETLVEKLKKAIPTQRAFWKDTKFDYYTVIMTPNITQKDSTYSGQSIVGSGVYNGFIMELSNNPFNAWKGVTHVFNHELMHEWIGGNKIPIKNEELNYWFSEGFTDYYTYKNMLRSGELTLEAWQKSFNEDVIKAHYDNPERNKPNYIVKDDFWKGMNIQKIPYRRGAIFAFWLDNQILKQSKYTLSLDDLMRELLQICTTQKKKVTDDFFLEIASKYINKKDLPYFFQKHVISGVDLELKNEDSIEGFTIEYIEKIPTIKADKELLKRYLLK